MKKVIGIYKIENKITGQIYVGSSVTCIDSRWKSHIKDLTLNRHHSSKLQNSWNKYGEKSFEFSILEVCEKESCLAREQYFIDTLNPFFNICRVAGNCTGRKFSEATRKRMSEIKKLQKLPEALLKQQAPKHPRKNDGSKFCRICTEFKFFKRQGNLCNDCYRLKRPSRKGTASFLRDKPIIANCEFNELEFPCMAQAERFFKENGVTFNLKTLKESIKKCEKYKGYYWSYK